MFEFLRLVFCGCGGMMLIMIVSAIGLLIAAMRAPTGEEIPGVGFVRIEEKDDETR